MIKKVEFANDIIRSYEDYIKLFELSKEEQIMGEASVSYLNEFEMSITNIKKIYGHRFKDIKIIIILRNPIDRAYSHYFFRMRRGLENLSFEDAIRIKHIENRMDNVEFCDYIRLGMYYERVSAYIEEFSNVKIFFLEELKAYKKLVRELFEFLGVNSDITSIVEVKANPSGIPKSSIFLSLIDKSTKTFKYVDSILFPKQQIPYYLKQTLFNLKESTLKKALYKPEMHYLTREKLVNIYRDDILSLQKLLNRDLKHWLK